jgi:hypothetical protein
MEFGLYLAVTNRRLSNIDCTALLLAQLLAGAVYYHLVSFDLGLTICLYIQPPKCLSVHPRT